MVIEDAEFYFENIDYVEVNNFNFSGVKISTNPAFYLKNVANASIENSIFYNNINRYLTIYL